MTFILIFNYNGFYGHLLKTPECAFTLVRSK